MKIDDSKKFSFKPENLEIPEWTVDQTFRLIDLYKKYKPLLKKHTTISVFSLISKKLLEDTGIEVSFLFTWFLDVPADL